MFKFKPLKPPPAVRVFQRSVHRHRVSNLFRPVNVLPFGSEKNASETSHKARTETESLCNSARLLVDQGIIRPVPHSFGMFNYLPLAKRSLDKLTNLINESMEAANCQQVQLPSIVSEDLWKISRRSETLGKELIRLSDRHDKTFCLNPTHEEVMTSLVASASSQISYKNNLPLRLYQITNKFRDEIRPRLGLLRAREFIMKDLYTFDRDLKEAEKTYEEIEKVYEDFFLKLGVPFCKVIANTGMIGGSKSHEFHFKAVVGEDVILRCSRCHRGKNLEVEPEKTGLLDCPECQGLEVLEESRGIEVAHLFLLGEKYSKAFQAHYRNLQGKPELTQMGCYGIGVSRILAASVEVLSSEKELRWPMRIAPFSTIVIIPKKGSKEEQAWGDQPLDFYDNLNSNVFRHDVLLDDRGDVTVGGKLREAKKVGYPIVVLFGKDCFGPDEPLVEVHHLSSHGKSSMTKMSLASAMESLKRLSNQ